MIRIVGYSACMAALVLSLWGMVAAIAGARTRRADLIRSAENAALGNFALLLLANSAMVYALVTHDFSVDYVAQVGSRATPLFFTIISLWSALEGSILFWGLVLAGFTAAAVLLYRGRMPEILPYAVATMLGVGVFFYMLLAFPANPFGAVFPVPLDGPGPNPLLQNHILMAIHPPFLYLGYVGMTVPFAFAVGALVSGKLDGEWVRVARTWMVFAWAFLSLAIIMGMWWSYEVLGWGGYWAWDPVENASFLPWLTATAFLHSRMVEERRGLLRVWNLSLVIATFVLTVLGTFLTRSGVLSSVHAFTQGTIGYWFLAFIAVVVLFSAVLLAGRSGELKSNGKLDSPVSREAAFLVNNLLFTAFTFTVLLGTLFPLVAEAVRGVKVSVGAPFFNTMTIPLCIALLLLVGIGPLLPWRRAPTERLKERMRWPTLALGLGLGLALLFGERRPSVILAIAFAAFSLVANVGEFVRGTLTRRRAHGEAHLYALGRLVAANPKRYGGYLAHIGVILLAIGITGSSAYTEETEATLAQGETMRVGAYEVEFRELWARDEPHRFVIAAETDVSRDGKQLKALQPKLNFYGGRDEPVTTPAVYSMLRGDVYLNLMAFERDGSSATIHAYFEPLVGWIWIGGFLVFAGAFIAIWPFGRAARAPRGEAMADGWSEPEAAGEPAVR